MSTPISCIENDVSLFVGLKEQGFGNIAYLLEVKELEQNKIQAAFVSYYL